MGVLGVRTEHRYQTCRDESCERFGCRVYREGHRHGKEEGRAEGRAEGHAEGYAEGFSDGLASCPGPHTGG
jgi:flagellar biosynthesis/type III secretory pathway protein FliH